LGTIRHPNFKPVRPVGVLALVCSQPVFIRRQYPSSASNYRIRLQGESIVFRLEVIDYIDQSNQSLVARVPEAGTAAIQFGAQLIVQQSQEAIFFRDGRAMDSFGPGRYTLTTANLPIIGGILTAPFERSPFQACVYFVGKQTFIDQRWGTRNPITVRDPQFGVVRLRGYGKFAYRVAGGALLLNTIVGTQGKFTTEEIVNYLRDIIVAGLTDLLGTAGIGLLDMPARMDDISAAARVKLGDQFSKYGLELTEFFISNISPPDEVQKAIDARSSMAVLGDLKSYSMYATANAIQAAGNASGGNPLGFGLGMAIPQILQQQANAPAMSAPSISPSAAANKAAGNLLAPLDFSGVKPTTPEDLHGQMKTIAQQFGWPMDELDQNSLAITVQLASARRQKVYLELDRKDNDGNRVLGIWSTCGTINPAAAMTVLRNNDSVVHGAFAIRRTTDGEVLVLRSNVLADLTDPGEMAKIISAVAWQADQVEQQLSGAGDQY
jgi:membrane protease subunit (stomatin/prohibitin family)